MGWELDGRPKECKACLADQAARKVPIHKRTLTAYPCDVHGDPRALYPANTVWIVLYERLQPYHEYTQAGTRVNLQLLRWLCDDFGLRFERALFKIELIFDTIKNHKAVMTDGKTEGSEKSSAGHEKTSSPF